MHRRSFYLKTYIIFKTKLDEYNKEILSYGILYFFVYRNKHKQVNFKAERKGFLFNSNFLEGDF